MTGKNGRECFDRVMIPDPMLLTVAVMRDDRSRTRSALIVVPEEVLFRRMETCWPTTKSAGAANRKPEVLTGKLSAWAKSTSKVV